MGVLNVWLLLYIPYPGFYKDECHSINKVNFALEVGNRKHYFIKIHF